MHRSEEGDELADLIGSEAVCQALDIDRSTLSRWVNSNPPKITPAERLPGKQGMYFSPDEVSRVKADLAEKARAKAARLASA
jgi:predicted site-specific integrase-resolvase